VRLHSGGEISVRKILFAALLSLLTITPASAELRIEGSAGGVIGDYMRLFLLVRETGHRVVIDGPCLSACTMVLSFVPHDRICVTPRAILGFHAAWTPSDEGLPLTHRGATRLMMATYPAPIRAWIKRRGGLSRQTILLRGRELASMYRSCG
jgi:hypothetical protein